MDLPQAQCRQRRNKRDHGGQGRLSTCLMSRLRQDNRRDRRDGRKLLGYKRLLELV